MRLIQHKREAYWFYRFLSLWYDRWVNPLFWTPAMRGLALDEARLEPGVTVLDVGAGTGFTTAGIVARVDAASVTMLDQSPHQLKRSRAKPELEACPRVLGDAENLPFADDAFDRYVSAGSIEYWPDPLRGIAEAYRVTRADGVALVIGPVRPGEPRRPRAGRGVDAVPAASRTTCAGWRRPGSPTCACGRWRRTGTATPACPTRWPSAASSRSPGRRRRRRAAVAEEAPSGPLRFAARFVAGSAAGAVFVPIAAALALRARRAERRAAA